MQSLLSKTNLFANNENRFCSMIEILNNIFTWKKSYIHAGIFEDSKWIFTILLKNQDIASFYHPTASSVWHRDLQDIFRVFPSFPYVFFLRYISAPGRRYLFPFIFFNMYLIICTLDFFPFHLSSLNVYGNMKNTIGTDMLLLYLPRKCPFYDASPP